MSENDFYVAIQLTLEEYCKDNPKTTGDDLFELVESVVEEFISEFPMPIRGVTNEL